MEKPKSFVYIVFCLTICLAFAIGSNYLINTITQANMIYNSNESRKIGATYMTYNNTFYSVVNEEISKIVKEHGDQLITLDPAMSLKKQKEQINGKLFVIYPSKMRFLLETEKMTCAS